MAAKNPAAPPPMMAMCMSLVYWDRNIRFKAKYDINRTTA
jgi:hypothetical protein